MATKWMLFLLTLSGLSLLAPLAEAKRGSGGGGGPPIILVPPSGSGGAMRGGFEGGSRIGGPRGGFEGSFRHGGGGLDGGYTKPSSGLDRARGNSDAFARYRFIDNGSIRRGRDANSSSVGSPRYRFKQRQKASLAYEGYPTRYRDFDGKKHFRKHAYGKRHRHGHHHHRHHKRYKNFIYFYEGWWYDEPWWLYDYASAEDEHVRWCKARYRSYDIRTNTYLTFSRKRRQCISPYWNSSIVSGAY